MMLPKHPLLRGPGARTSNFVFPLYVGAVYANVVLFPSLSLSPTCSTFFASGGPVVIKFLLVGRPNGGDSF
jgi:hypothetical protein